MQSIEERSPANPAHDGWRKTSQALRPLTHDALPDTQYDVYPAHDLPPGTVHVGFAALAEMLDGQSIVVIDGCGGVLWSHFQAALDQALTARGVQANWQNVESALRSPAEIDALVEPFLGGDDPLFGSRFTGTLADFFDQDRLRALRPDPDVALSILYGNGAALANWPGSLIYIDVPKSEVQFRARAGSVSSLGAQSTTMQPDSKAIYKRFYFVDWVALNQHKAAIWPHIDMWIDEQRPDDPACMRGTDLRAALTHMSRSCFRARPWFEPGVWGGQWIKEHIPQVPQDTPNIAWSFELITPENGLLLQSDGLLCEVSFECLMYQESNAVLGSSAPRFKHDFPIRFDFLDTFDGGNLSIQCHPRPEYALEHFGEPFTQDETYYILDCKSGAQVYLGFQPGIDRDEFCSELESLIPGTEPIDIVRYVHSEATEKHGLYLIPNGTIHGAGKDNLVLEISATPYIFTFKIYDWMRLDLDGQPRPINLERAFDNLYFDRQGERIAREFVSHPAVLDTGNDWRIIHLPTHAEHFYDVHRLEFATHIEVETHGSPHVLSLVEGQVIDVLTANGHTQRFSYAETFVIPAAAAHYQLINRSSAPVKVVKAFMKA